MKALKFLFVGACALMLIGIVSCNDDEDEIEPSYVVSATISSSDPSFTATAEGGTISFVKGGGEVVVNVECEEEWAVNCSEDVDWLGAIVSTDATYLTVIASSNPEEEDRSVVIYLSIVSSATQFAAITVNQYGTAYVSLSDTSLSFEAAGGSASVSVEANYDWECSTEADWVTLSADGNTLTVTVSENESYDEREAVVVVTATDGDYTAEAELSVLQGYVLPEGALVIVYTIPEIESVPAGDDDDDDDEAEVENGVVVALPFDVLGEIDCTVNWGDGGEEEAVKTAWPTHIYTEARSYNVVIEGTVTALNCFDFSEDEDGIPVDGITDYVTEVKQWGSTGLTSMDSAFYGCEYLTSLPDETGDSFADVTVFWYAFGECSSLTSIPNGIFDKCSGVKDFTSTFDGCASITKIPTGLFDACVDVTSFERVFAECESLTEIPDGLFDKCTKVTNFNSIFYKCSGIKEIPTDLFDNNKSAVRFFYTFYNCTGLTGESPYTMVNGTKVHLYERADHTDDGFAAPTSSSSCFKDCTGLSDYDDIPDDWK